MRHVSLSVGRLATVVVSRPLNTDRKTRRVASSRLWRTVALFFLALTFSELALAGTCGPELLGLPSDIADHILPAASVGLSDGEFSMSSEENQTPHDHSGEGGCSSDDCFCCCGHLNVPAPFIVPAGESARSNTDTIETLLQSGSRCSLFRPPRSL